MDPKPNRRTLVWLLTLRNWAYAFKSAKETGSDSCISTKNDEAIKLGRLGGWQEHTSGHCVLGDKGGEVGWIRLPHTTMSLGC